MKKIIFTLILFISSATYGASITATPFSFEFYTTQDHLDIKAELKLYCRYEEWVFGDSAEWVTFQKQKNLKVAVNNQGDHNQVIISSPERLYIEVTGAFKPSKQCKGEILLTFTDKIYALGNASSFNNPIVLKYLNRQSYQPGDIDLDLSKIINDINNQNIEFRFQVLKNIIHVYLGNDERWFDHTSVGKDPTTNMPYRIKNE